MDTASSAHEWRTLFSLLDRDQDGKISASDLRNLMCSLGQSPTPQQLKQVSNLAGLNPGSALDLSKFLDHVNADVPTSEAEPLRQTFSLFDVDRDGMIDGQDLAIALTRLGEKVSVQDATQLLQDWANENGTNKNGTNENGANENGANKNGANKNGANKTRPRLDYQKFVNVMLAKPKNWTENQATIPVQPKPSQHCSDLNAAEYVRSLQAQALTHKAVHHPYLVRLAQAQVPNVRAALEDFAHQYYAYSQHFRSYLQGTIAHLTPEQRVGLEENLAEECGQLDVEHQEQLKTLGIELEWVKDIPHPQLFRQFQQAVGLATKDSNHYQDQYCEEAIAFSHQIKSACAQTAAMAVGALGLGTELVVQPMYRYLLQAIQSHTALTPQDYVFFSLHAEVDDHHAEVLLNLAIDLAETPTGRTQLAQGMAIALNARCTFWNALLTRALTMPTSSSSAPELPESSTNTFPSASTNTSKAAKSVWNLNQKGATAETLYNAQSHSWVRREPSCLSDFTARPEVFKLCAPVKGLRVLDLGCGEGYCSRELKRQGAAELIGVDVSDNMIAAAKTEEQQSPLGIRYLQGDATDIATVLQRHRFITEDEAVNGAFDLIVCVFLFNYVTLADMETCMQHAHQLLRPGGRFVFSVPHPSFAFWDRQPAPPFYFKRHNNSGHNPDEMGSAKTDSVETDSAKTVSTETDSTETGSTETGYFTSQDQLLPGIICRKDGTELNVQVRHKTLQDYFDVLKRCGFTTMPTVKELHVTDELLALDAEYFSPLLNVPLHLAFSVQKAQPVVTAIAPQRSQEIIWSRLFNQHDYCLDLSSEVVAEFQTAYAHLQRHGVTWENYYTGDAGDLPHMDALGREIRQRLQQSTGIALLKGFDLAQWGDQFDQQEQAAKLFYMILSQSIGTILTKRGRLYDVIDRHLNVADDNVLFSATNEASGWHTDSTDKDFFPDWVGLMSLRAAPSGGELQVTNAINVYYRLRSVLPSFIFRQLERPIIRDLIETGLGAASGDMLERLRRHPQINVQTERVRQNTFPIFSHDPKTHQFSFRYMRYWIESGHQRADEPLSPLLAIALNALDKTLADDAQIQRVEHLLQPGEMVFLNNHICPHNRTSFEDDPTHPRKMVRVWLRAM